MEIHQINEQISGHGSVCVRVCGVRYGWPRECVCVCVCVCGCVWVCGVRYGWPRECGALKGALVRAEGVHTVLALQPELLGLLLGLLSHTCTGRHGAQGCVIVWRCGCVW